MALTELTVHTNIKIFIPIGIDIVPSFLQEMSGYKN